MNDSYRRINQDIKEILEYPEAEPAFEGTVKEGLKRRYTIINERDVNKYLSQHTKDELRIALNTALQVIEDGRIEDGKKPYNNYVVINLDEPYADEVIEIMKHHDHWG
ncbi:hypothetical protein [Oceanobacillus salinisoli]|uniref:hypothetical protein n=1 Tax=Oceanobacillus salinisoli TaxID=2678611 RepID=UPI0012E135FF|nr:hypothetical protein [Oceanobacillus salinisoli]